MSLFPFKIYKYYTFNNDKKLSKTQLFLENRIWVVHVSGALNALVHWIPQLVSMATLFCLMENRYQPGRSSNVGEERVFFQRTRAHGREETLLCDKMAFVRNCEVIGSSIASLEHGGECSDQL